MYLKNENYIDYFKMNPYIHISLEIIKYKTNFSHLLAA